MGMIKIYSILNLFKEMVKCIAQWEGVFTLITSSLFLDSPLHIVTMLYILRNLENFTKVTKIYVFLHYVLFILPNLNDLVFYLKNGNLFWIYKTIHFF